MPIACLDVHYADPRAAAACVVLSSWQASEPEECVVRTIDNVMPYEPGAFYRRELPCIEEVLKALRHVPEILVVDGYVWLGQGKKGLGAYLFEARGSVGAVVGVAKTRFIGAEPVSEVLRAWRRGRHTIRSSTSLGRIRERTHRCNTNPNPHPARTI